MPGRRKPAIPTASAALPGATTPAPGVEKDPRKAVELYQKAVDQGHLRAMHNLAWCYRMGQPARTGRTEGKGGGAVPPCGPVRAT